MENVESIGLASLDEKPLQFGLTLNQLKNSGLGKRGHLTGYFESLPKVRLQFWTSYFGLA